MLSVQRLTAALRPCVETCLVNHRLKLVYAYVPKAACTSIKAWLVRYAGWAPELLTKIIQAEAAGLTPGSSGYPKIHDHLDQHYSLRKAATSEIESLWDNGRYFKFSFVRHPLSRLVSAYLDKVVWAKSTARRVIRNRQFRNGHLTWRQAAQWFRRNAGFDAERSLTFREFVNQLCREDPERMNPHFRSQARLLRGIPLDFIGRVENSEADFAYVQDHLGIRQPLTSRNKTAYSAGAENVLAADWPAARFRGSAPAPVWQRFFDEPLRKSAEQLYADDFAQFGYQS